MGVVNEYPITLHIYDVGDILLLENTLVSQQPKEIDARHHFIYDYVKDLTAKNRFFCSDENIANPFTKNRNNGPLELLASR